MQSKRSRRTSSPNSDSAIELAYAQEWGDEDVPIDAIEEQPRFKVW